MKDENHENEPYWPCGVEMIPHIFVDKFEWSNTCVDHGHMYGSLRSIKDDQEVIFPHSKHLEKKKKSKKVKDQPIRPRLEKSRPRNSHPKIISS